MDLPASPDVRLVESHRCRHDERVAQFSPAPDTMTSLFFRRTEDRERL
jgi:hypothetical protein